jgi:CAAX protease family protein
VCRPPHPRRAAGSVECVTGVEDTGIAEPEGHGSDVESALPRPSGGIDTPFTADTWQPHTSLGDLRPSVSPAPRQATDGAATDGPPVDAAAPPYQRYEVSDPATYGPPAVGQRSSASAGAPDHGQPASAQGTPAGVSRWGPPAAHPGRGGLFGPPPPPRAPHRWGLGAYFLVEAVFLLVSALLASALAGRLTSSAAAVALALSVPTVCAAGLAALITQVRGNGPRIDLGLSMTRRDIVVGVACGFAGLVITIPASVLYIAIVGADATSAVGAALGAVRAGPLLAVTIFVIVVFVAPLCEEIVYRGLLWGAIERLGANRWWALGVTTFVFALAHFEFFRTPLLLVVAIPIGIARVITARLPAGVIAHQINNLLPGLVLMLGLLGLIPMT